MVFFRVRSQHLDRYATVAANADDGFYNSVEGIAKARKGLIVLKVCSWLGQWGLQGRDWRKNPLLEP